MISMLTRRALIASAAAAAGWAEVSVPRKSPELAFTLPSKGSALLSSYRGKVVALEFILTTCPHCQAAAKVMSKLHARYGAQGLQPLDVAVNQNADLLVENFAKDYGASFPVGWTPLEQMMAYMSFTGLPSLPQLVLIDRGGFIRFQTPRQGDGEAMKEEVLDRRIRDML